MYIEYRCSLAHVIMYHPLQDIMYSSVADSSAQSGSEGSYGGADVMKRIISLPIGKIAFRYFPMQTVCVFKYFI